MKGDKTVVTWGCYEDWCDEQKVWLTEWCLWQMGRLVFLILSTLVEDSEFPPPSRRDTVLDTDILLPRGSSEHRHTFTDPMSYLSYHLLTPILTQTYRGYLQGSVPKHAFSAISTFPVSWQPLEIDKARSDL